MNDQMYSGIADATRLTRQGRLDEATAAIRRALGGTFVPTKQPGRSGDGPIDVTSRIVRKTPAVRRPVPQTAPSPNLRPRRVDRPSETTAKRAASARVPEGARFVERSFTNGVGTREYRLYVPGGHAGQAVPLIVMLHGCTQGPDDFAAGTRMNGSPRSARSLSPG